MTQPGANVGVVLIGRNEGDRLVRALAAVGSEACAIIYVDSGSTDDSIAAARKAGAEVVLLDIATPFTAARARNAGLAVLNALPQPPELVQFVDGDCQLREGWVLKARAFIHDHPKVAVVCGRRRERFPEASFYNMMIDHEWDTPVGEARACGGDALMRRAALNAVEGFNPSLIAGEEPELCVRLRKAGWLIWRLEAEMTWHDANITRFGQWWRRARRAGHAFAEGAALHGSPPEHHNTAQIRRALIWGAGLPLAILLGLMSIGPWALVMVLLWTAKVILLTRRGLGWRHAAFLTLGNIPEALGALSYYWKRLTGKQAVLIEYK